ncbi:MAG TPA: hypothetical protein VNO35_29245, partial [Steroidobacteraceae bacterium]|nr:hypothetical protein [Steroidobacteraceae bacterium]
MAVLGILSVTLEVPELETGVRFYTDAGLTADITGNVARLRCPNQTRHSVELVGGASRKRLHHLALRAENLAGISARVVQAGGKIVAAPPGFEAAGSWVEDPHGMLIHLSQVPADAPLEAGGSFEINAPGRLVRIRRSAVRPGAAYGPAKPLRLGHVLVFSPDVPKSVRFV